MSRSEALFGNLMGAGKWGSSEEGGSGNGEDKTRQQHHPQRAAQEALSPWIKLGDT